MADPFTFAELDAVLRVDGANLVWRVTRGKARTGARAGRQDKQGYIVLQFQGRDLQAHRVVWLLTHGEWPAGMLDHKNGRREDNHPDNLRPATNAENQQNRKPVGEIPFKGVVRHPCGKFQATCARAYLGLYDTPEAAARAYDAAAAHRFGRFARLNFGSTA